MKWAAGSISAALRGGGLSWLRSLRLICLVGGCSYMGQRWWPRPLRGRASAAARASRPAPLWPDLSRVARAAVSQRNRVTSADDQQSVTQVPYCPLQEVQQLPHSITTNRPHAVTLPHVTQQRSAKSTFGTEASAPSPLLRPALGCMAAISSEVCSDSTPHPPMETERTNTHAHRRAALGFCFFLS